MADKPTTAAGYKGERLGLVRATCLYVATKLGDLMDDLVVVGGLVPSLLVDQENRAEGVDAHVGTMDLDVGLTVALLDEGRYRELTERLRRAGFSQDTTAEGGRGRAAVGGSCAPGRGSRPRRRRNASSWSRWRACRIRPPERRTRRGGFSTSVE